MGGIILICCVLVSLAIANSPLGNDFAALLHTELGSERLGLRYTVLHWINDGLMAVFFLLIGLEIKRELVEGELSSVKKASLPVIAALQTGLGLSSRNPFAENGRALNKSCPKRASAASPELGEDFGGFPRQCDVALGVLLVGGS